MAGRFVSGVGSNDVEWPWKAGCEESNFPGGT